MTNLNLSSEEYIIKKGIYGDLNGVYGEFIITNENIIFACEEKNIVKKIAFSNIKNPKGHLQAFYDENEEKIDLLCNDGQFELNFEDFDYEKFIDLLQENINGSKKDSNTISDRSEKDAFVSQTQNKKNVDNEEFDASVESIKKGFSTFAGIAKNVVNASTNYIKDASEKYLQNSQVANKLSQDIKESGQIEDIDELKSKLKKLKEMYDEGLLTHDEYEEKRNAMLGKKNKESNPIEKVVDIAKGKSKVKKCPSCGEILSVFDIKCPTCGYEIRDVKNSDAMDDFQKGLNDIEKMRNAANELNAFGIKFRLNRKNQDIETTKVEYIRNYVIPRTKEDLMEFMVLAKSNVEPHLYTKGLFTGFHGCKNQEEYDIKKRLSDAWFSMMQQIFDKSKIIFENDDTTYKKIEKMYVDIYNKIM